VGKDLGLSVFTLLLIVLSLLTITYSSLRVSSTCYSSVRYVMVSRFPELSDYVNLSNYSVASTNLNYTDLKILVYKWVSRGVSVEVQATEETCDVVRFEVVVDTRNINESILNTLLDRLEANVKDWYSDTKNLISATSIAEVLGGQVVINDTPIYFLDPTYVTITPITVRYFVYPSPPIVIYSFVNYFPTIKKLLAHIPGFNLSEEYVKEVLEKNLNITEYKGITKSYVVLYGVLRPAYVVAVTPYRNVVILADDGEILTQRTATGTQTTPGSNQTIVNLGLALILTAFSLLIAYVIWLRKRRD